MTMTSVNWEPIETAPKDGRLVELGWIVNGKTIEQLSVFSHWDSDRWSGNWTPTHWKPVCKQK